jgi:hypothetical protein
VQKITEILGSEDPAGLDYYACGSEALRADIEGFIDDREIPRSRFLYQPI